MRTRLSNQQRRRVKRKAMKKWWSRKRNRSMMVKRKKMRIKENTTTRWYRRRVPKSSLQGHMSSPPCSFGACFRISSIPFYNFYSIKTTFWFSLMQVTYW